MVGRLFKIMSNSEEYLTAEIIAMALLKQITLNPAEPDISFAVAHIGEEDKKLED